MKKVFSGIIIGLLSGGVGVWLYLHHYGPVQPELKAEEKPEEPHVQRDEDDNIFLKLDQEFQWHAGLKTAELEAAQLKPEVKAFGRVLDPSSLAVSLSEISAARAQLDASTKEAERLKILFNQNQNASARAVEAAEAAVKRDQIALQAAQLRLITAWGKAVVERPDLDVFIHSLITQENSLVRVDVPAADKMEGAPTAARLALLSATDAPLDAEFLGAAITADPQTLGRGFLFLVKGRALAANAAVTGWLSLPGEMEKGVIIPRDAILRHDGGAYVYIQPTEETFERKEVALLHPLAAGWFTDALKPGVKVVTTGAQQLLSEELKGAAE